MNGGKILDEIVINLRNDSGEIKPVYIDVYDNSLSRKWLSALNTLLKKDYHLEKNYCFLGWADGARAGQILVDEINSVIDYINNSDIDYNIDDEFTLANSINLDGNLKVNHEHFNHLHRYFEELQGTAQNLSTHFLNANAEERWHIRQVNLLCHEFESWALSNAKKHNNPEWQRPSQLMCWINAPRFELDEQDFELFGVDALLKDTGGVYLGVNKAVGKHHYEVYTDEGADSRIDELTTTSMRGQTLAAGDFDIEWGKNTREYDWKQQDLNNFRSWLVKNGFDPEDKSLTIGHPCVGQVDLPRTFGTTESQLIWQQMYNYLDVYSIRTSDAYAEYDYRWSDPDFVQRQVTAIGKH